MMSTVPWHENIFIASPLPVSGVVRIGTLVSWLGVVRVFQLAAKIRGKQDKPKGAEIEGLRMGREAPAENDFSAFKTSQNASGCTA